MLVLRALAHLPTYQRSPSALDGGLKVAGELGPHCFVEPVTILFSNENTGARVVARELRFADVSGSAVVREAAPVLAHSNPVRGKTVLLVYLNESAFLDPLEIMASTIKKAMDLDITIAMAHEQDLAKGACAFDQVYEQAPRELQIHPYRLFDTMAVALYPGLEHRTTSAPTAARRESPSSPQINTGALCYRCATCCAIWAPCQPATGRSPSRSGGRSRGRLAHPPPPKVRWTWVVPRRRKAGGRRKEVQCEGRRSVRRRSAGRARRGKGMSGPERKEEGAGKHTTVGPTDGRTRVGALKKNTRADSRPNGAQNGLLT